MKFSAREGGILAESAAPSGAASLLDALRAAQEHFDGLAKLHADTEKKCAAMLASTRAEANNILDAARAKAYRADCCKYSERLMWAGQSKADRRGYRNITVLVVTEIVAVRVVPAWTNPVLKRVPGVVQVLAVACGLAYRLGEKMKAG